MASAYDGAGNLRSRPAISPGCSREAKCAFSWSIPFLIRTDGVEQTSLLLKRRDCSRLSSSGSRYFLRPGKSAHHGRQRVQLWLLRRGPGAGIAAHGKGRRRVVADGPQFPGAGGLGKITRECTFDGVRSAVSIGTLDPKVAINAFQRPRRTWGMKARGVPCVSPVGANSA